MADPEQATEIGRLPLVEEVARIRRRRLARNVRVAVTTAEEQRAVEAVLHRREAEITRVPVGREVEAPPPVRREGDTLVVPVLEERVEVVRRLVLVEELRLTLRTEAETVTLPVTLRRQSFAVQHGRTIAAEIPDHVIPGEHSSMTQTLIALFDTRHEAERAAEALRGLNVHVSNVQLRDSAAAGWMPEEDRATYQEGLRRGGAAVTAEVAEQDMPLAMDAMEAAGAVDLDTREAEWRSQGWTGAITGDAPEGTPGNPAGTMASRGVDQALGTNISGAHPENETRHGATTTGTGMAGATAAMGTTGQTHRAETGREEVIPLAEERLRIGKRVAHGGRVRVRAYTVETPVEEQVRLREEHVRVERHAVDRAVTGSEAELFRDRVIEAEESVEEAVVQKEARITGEVVVNKETTERTETIRDTVRRTEVDVDETSAANDPVRRPGKGAA